MHGPEVSHHRNPSDDRKSNPSEDSYIDRWCDSHRMERRYAHLVTGIASSHDRALQESMNRRNDRKHNPAEIVRRRGWD